MRQKEYIKGISFAERFRGKLHFEMGFLIFDLPSMMEFSKALANGENSWHHKDHLLPPSIFNALLAHFQLFVPDFSFSWRREKI
jgi:hypothetical protein